MSRVRYAYDDALARRSGSRTPGLFHPGTARKDIAAWQAENKKLLRLLHRPRYMKASIIPEFQQMDGREYFVRGHAVPTADGE